MTAPDVTERRVDLMAPQGCRSLKSSRDVIGCLPAMQMKDVIGGDTLCRQSSRSGIGNYQSSESVRCTFGDLERLQDGSQPRPCPIPAHLNFLSRTKLVHDDAGLLNPLIRKWHLQGLCDGQHGCLINGQFVDPVDG